MSKQKEIIENANQLDTMLVRLQQLLYTETNGEWFPVNFLIEKGIYKDEKTAKDFMLHLFSRNLLLMDESEGEIIYKIVVDVQERIMFLDELKNNYLSKIEILNKEMLALKDGKTTTKTFVL